MPSTDLSVLVQESMMALAARRPIFHSEADWQLALAWEIHLERPAAQIRLEKRVANDPRIELDVLIHDAFRIHEGRTLTGLVEWGPKTGSGTKSGRAMPLTVRGKYEVRWDHFSNVGAAQFRYAAICVSGVATTATP